MNNLFMPKEVEDGMVKYLALDKSQFFVFGVGDMYKANYIYGLYDFDMDPIKLATRGGVISDFCVYDDSVWDCGSYGLFKDTFGSPEKLEIKYPGAGVYTAKKEAHNVLSLFKRSDGTMVGGAYDTSFSVTDKVENTAKSNWIFSMVEFDNKLFCSECDPDNHKYSIKDFGPDAGFVGDYSDCCYLGVFNDRLYHSCENLIYDTLAGKSIIKRKNTITGLVEYGGKLYDYGFEGEVFETFSGDKVYDFKDRVNSAIALPRYLLKEAL